MGNNHSCQRLQASAKSTPIRALRPTAIQILAERLNGIGIIYNGRLNGIFGVMELAQCTGEEISELDSLGPSTTHCFLRHWEHLARAKGLEAPTVYTGWEILLKLGRDDVIHACRTVVEDIRVWEQARRAAPPPVEKRVITKEDALQGTFNIYDAFVMYDEADVSHVRILLARAEGPPHELKLLVPDRDLLPGLPIYDTWAYAMEHRCRKLILLVSKNFETSESCTFVVNFAQALSPAAKDRKIIPIILDDTRLPRVLNFVRSFTVNDDSDWTLFISAIKSPILLGRSSGHSESQQVANVVPFRRSVSSVDEEQLASSLAGLRTTDRNSAPDVLYRRMSSHEVDRNRNSESLAESPEGRSRPSFVLNDTDDLESDTSLSTSSSSYCVVQSAVVKNINTRINNLNVDGDQAQATGGTDLNVERSTQSDQSVNLIELSEEANDVVRPLDSSAGNVSSSFPDQDAAYTARGPVGQAAVVGPGEDTVGTGEEAATGTTAGKEKKTSGPTDSTKKERVVILETSV